MRILSEVGPRIKRLLGVVGKGDIFVVLVIVFVGFGGFGLGRLSKIASVESEVVVWEYEKNLAASAPAAVSGSPVGELAPVAPTTPISEGSFVGSKNSDKYHYPWCPGALRIKEDNKRWFATREEAEAAGYIPAQNCKGL